MNHLRRRRLANTYTYASRERCDAVTFSVDNSSAGTDVPANVSPVIAHPSRRAGSRPGRRGQSAGGTTQHPPDTRRQPSYPHHSSSEPGELRDRGQIPADIASELLPRIRVSFANGLPNPTARNPLRRASLQAMSLGCAVRQRICHQPAARAVDSSAITGSTILRVMSRVGSPGPQQPAGAVDIDERNVAARCGLDVDGGHVAGSRRPSHGCVYSISLGSAFLRVTSAAHEFRHDTY